MWGATQMREMGRKQGPTLRGISHEDVALVCLDARPCTMSLLSPSESHAFQSFLSSIDYDYTVADTLFTASEWSVLADDIPVPHASPGKEALAKATKDLMSLQQPVGSIPQSWSPSTCQNLPPILKSSANRPPQSFFTTNASSSSSQRHHPANPFYYLHQPHSSNARGESPIHIAPHTTVTPSVSIKVSTPPPPSTSSSSSVTYASSSSAHPSVKRGFSDDSTSSATTRKRRRASTASSSHTPPTSRDSTSSSAGPSGKTTLLTPSQKKANHIQSEQKRRANIRRGYEALCETIPALREAIRAEEEVTAAAATGSTGHGSGRRRKSRARAAEDGEKIDGRAGPKSENIVLQKSE